MSAKTTKLLPRSFVQMVLRLTTNALLVKHRLMHGKLTIRKNTSDHYVFRDIFLFKEFKLPVSIEPKLIIDLGAYTGLSTTFFALKYPKARIIAVEPESSNFELLEFHTQKNPNVDRINAGVWSSNAFLKITNKATEKWAFTVEEVSESDDYDVKSITIDSILKNSGCDTIDILKIDIEGAEKELLSKNVASWISKVKVLVIELHDRLVEGCSESLYNAIDLAEWDEYKQGEKIVLIRKAN